MKRLLTLSVSLIVALALTGCAALQNISYTDDLYAIHDKIAIANKQKAEAELAKAQAEARQAQYEAAYAEIKAKAAQQGITVKEGTIADVVDSYDSVLADSYESAYARRLYGFSSGSYRMPSSYYTLRYNNAFTFASAYDPAFYNVMVSGDLVWVEPKYITSMFGTWGASVVPVYNWYYGWYSPWSYWDWSYRYNPYFRHYPYHWDWGCNWYWGYNWHWGWRHHHHHYYPHYHHHHRPHYGHGGVGNTGHHSGYYGPRGRNPRATTPSVRGGSTSRPPQSSSSRVGSSGSSNYRSGYSGRSSGNSSYGGQGGSTYRSSGSSSYGGSSSSRSSGSYSGGSRSSSSSYSGGNSRGR